MSRYETLSPDLTSDFPDQWYDLAAADHFWMQWRFAVCVTQLRDLGIAMDAPWRGLEIGCAHGVVQRQLASQTSWRIDGCDLNQASLEANRAQTGRNLLYDIHDRKPEFDEAYDFLILFDVIEHIEDVKGFLESALFHLKPGGIVLLNVPALKPLESNYDRVVGHLRRYTRKLLSLEVEAAGLEVLDVRYWGLTMVPMLVARKLVTAFQRRGERIIELGFAQPRGVAGWILRTLMRAETVALKRPFLGTSVVAVARKGVAGRP